MTDDSLPASDILNRALESATRGWPVFPLAPGGKVPLTRDGFLSATTDPGQIRAWWASWPEANYGIRTGAASGLYVIDGDAPRAVAAIIPDVDTFLVESPHGGDHAYLRWEDGLGNTAKRLSPAVDTRGEGGYVVGPGSVLLPGRHGDCKLGPQCPGGKYVAVRQAPVAAIPHHVRTALVKAAPVERPPVDWAALSAMCGTESAQRYATTSIQEALADLGRAVEGERNHLSFARATRLVELCNLGWPGQVAQLEMVRRAHSAVAAATGLPDREIDVTWEHAVARVGDRPAELPPDRSHGSVIELPANFPAAGVGSQQDMAPAESAWESDVQRRMWSLEVDRVARERLNPPRSVDWDAEALDDAGMGEIEDATPLVADYLDMDTLARVNGPSGHGKSFVMVELAACIGNGLPWHGRATTRGKVIYVLAEGVRGMKRRAAAWRQHKERESTGIIWVPRAVQIGGPEWGSFVAWSARQEPVMIIFDTQARMTVGRRENDADDMGEVVNALDALRLATRACVTLVHHRGLVGDHGRGSTSVKGAMDTEIDVSKNGMNITVKAKKRKDGAEPPPLLLTMNAVYGSVVLAGDMDGQSAGGMELHTPIREVSAGDRARLAVIESLRHTEHMGDTKAAVLERARGTLAGQLGSASTSAVKKSIQRAWDRLAGDGRVAKFLGREAYVFLELDETEDLAANPRRTVSDGFEIHVPSERGA